MNIYTGTSQSMLQAGSLQQKGQVLQGEQSVYGEKMPAMSNEQLLEARSLAKALILNSAQVKDSLQVMQFLQNLSQGDILHATIKDIKNMNVLIQLSNGIELEAKLGEALSLNIEQELVFEVKENTDQGLILRPTNREQIPPELIKKSLQSAGLVQNDKNSAIVKTLISQGQPIHKEAIINTLKLANRYPAEPLEKLVEMQKHGLEINQANLKQYDNYQAGNYKVLGQLQQLSDCLGEYVADTSNVSFSQVSNLFEKLAAVEQGVRTEPIMTEEINKNTVFEKVDEMMKGSEEGFVGEITKKASEKITEEDINENVIQKSTAGFNKTETDIMNGQLEPVSIQESKIPNLHSQMMDISEHINLENLQETVKEALKSANSFKDIFNILKQLKELDISAEETRQITKSKAFKQAITSVFDRQFTIDLKPEEPAIEKQELKHLYEKLLRIADTLLETESKNIAGNEKLTQTASDLKSNLQFMIDVNQFANYIQIPYKVNERQEQSDLYVYGRKKQKQGQDEKITAFLHLDLEALGATDVHVELVNQSVSTRFVLDNRESELLVEKHLYELEERLRQKGYQVELKTETVERQLGAEHTVLDKIMQEDDMVSTIKRYSFDIRA